MIISCCVIVQTIVAFYLFNSLRPKDRFDRRLNIFLVTLLLHLGTRFFILFILKDYALYNNSITGFGLAYGPLLLFMTRLPSGIPFKRQDLIHFAPFFFFTLLYLLRAAADIFNLSDQILSPVTSSWYQWLTITSLAIYSIESLRVLKKMTFKVEMDKNQFQLLAQIATCTFGGAFVGVIAFIYHYISTNESKYDLRLIPYLTLFLIPVLILRYKLRSTAGVLVPGEAISGEKTQEFVLPMNEQPTREEEKAYKKSSLDEELMDEYEKTLLLFMEKSKAYLDSELSLDTLSSRIKIPKHHLTQVLNERIKKNFYGFVNEYRIKEAINKLGSEQENILSLALDCGFNSKSSFNNYFKKITGTTPSEFRKIRKVNSMQLAD